MKRLFALFIVLICFSGVAFSQKKSVGQVKTVVIDAGHGGAKPGAIGKHCQEKALTLQMSMKLGKLIEDNYPDVKVIYTRTKDVDIDLAERARIANKAKADLFISIHCNSWNNPTPTGVETYVMGLSQSRANMEVAKKENADILLEDDYQNNSDYHGFDPNSPESYVMFAMYQNAYLDKSLDFAEYIQNEYKQAIKTINRGVKQAEIYVLYKTSMPAVLTEVGFISNPEEERYMMSDEGQANIVVSIFNAFVAYKSSTEGGKKPADLKIDLEGYKKKVSKYDAPIVAQKQNAETEVTTGQVEPEEEASVAPKAEVQKKAAPKAEAPSSWVPSTAETHVEPPLPKEEPKVEEPKVEQPAQETVVEEPAKKAPAAQSSNDESGVVYKVQFMTSGRVVKAGASEFKGIKDYEYYKTSKYYCYTTGHLRTVKEASALQAKVRDMGHKDAFVIAFYNGERISMQRAKELEGK